MRLKPTKKTLIALGVAAVAFVVAAVFMSRAQSQQRKQWQAKLEAKQKEAEAIEASASQLESTLARRNEIHYLLGFVHGAKPNDYQPALLLEMTELAKRTGVRIGAFTPSEGAAGQQSPVEKLGKENVATHTFTSINASVEGTFHNVSRFFYRLAGLPKIVSIDTLQVQPVIKGSPDGVRALVQMTAYTVKEVDVRTSAVVAKLKEIREAEEKHKEKTKEYATLAVLNSEGLISLKEGETFQGYTFVTDKSTGKGSFKILANAKDPELHNLSIDQTNKVMDETDKVPYE